MADQYPAAWAVHGDSESGVLVRFETSNRPYWWLLCPVDATLFFDTVDVDCHSPTCQWDDVHEEAARVAREVSL